MLVKILQRKVRQIIEILLTLYSFSSIIKCPILYSQREGGEGRKKSTSIGLSCSRRQVIRGLATPWDGHPANRCFGGTSSIKVCIFTAGSRRPCIGESGPLRIPDRFFTTQKTPNILFTENVWGRERGDHAVTETAKYLNTVLLTALTPDSPYIPGGKGNRRREREPQRFSVACFSHVWEINGQRPS